MRKIMGKQKERERERLGILKTEMPIEVSVLFFKNVLPFL
jgi:hypothetical protein